MYNLANNRAMVDALRGSSVSDTDAMLRAHEYSKMFSRNEEMNNMFKESGLQTKMFSGYAETPLLSTQYFNASVASYVSSFAGYLSIEKDFDQPNGLFYWFDMLGVCDLRPVIPNLGPDQYNDINVLGGFEVEVTPSSEAKYSTLVGRKVLPGTIRVKIKTASDTYELVDNGQGKFMAVAGKISDSSINYLNGNVEFTLSSALTGDKSKESILIIGKEDVTGVPCNTDGAAAPKNDKRFMGKLQQLPLNTVPDMLVAEYNIASLGATKKATGSDMATFLFTRLRELYTKSINGKMVNTLENAYIEAKGTTMTDLDLSMSSAGVSSKFMDYRSRIDLFDAYLIDVESTLAKKAVKGVKTTAYLAGAVASSQFQKGGAIGKFEKNTKMTYISDLLGWYDGVPVLRSVDVDEKAGEGTFYAIHKTEDGQMAPLARGIYMPLTDTPTVGNYNNPTQMAAGIYYQEGVRMMAPELVQKVTFKCGL